MKRLLLLPFLFVNIMLFAQVSFTQLGTDIDGEANSDWSGASVSLSSDGSKVAIGASYNDGNGTNAGRVRIFENIGGSWSQIGQDIDGEAAGDRSGGSVSLSSDGSKVAIGAIWNDGNGNNAGHVRIFDYDGSSWTQIGQDIDGEAAGDCSGGSVSLSSDGSKVAIGANQNDGNGSDAGHVRIFENIGGSWSQIGSDIDGEAANDLFGRSVSLSSDGSKVAIGAHYNDGNGTNAGVFSAEIGHVRIFENIGGSWSQIGQDIDGEAAGDWSGGSVSLSSDGSKVAIGAHYNDGNGTFAGHVRIFENIGGSWTQIGQDIDGEAAGDRSGYSVSLSSDGSKVAIGAIKNDGNGNNAGHVRIFDYDGSSWTQIGQDIDGEAAGDQSGVSVSLSSDGSKVAIGAYRNGGNGYEAGHVRIYADTNAITQSTSCSISVTNVQDNTLCDDGSMSFIPNSSFDAILIDSFNLNSNNLSYHLFSGSVLCNYCGTLMGGGTVNFYGLIPDTYSLTMLYDDGNGYTCSSSTTISIVDLSTSNISVNQGMLYSPSCENSNTGAFNFEVFDGQPPYYYSILSNGNFITSGTSFNNNIFIDTVPAGVYDYQVTDDNNCFTSSNFSGIPAYVYEHQITASQDTICEGDIVTLSENNGAFVTWPDGSNNDIYSFSPSQSGFYSGYIDDDSLGFPNSCYDSVYIEVLNNSTFSEVLTLCDSIVWNGVTYDSSGVYSDTLQNSLGCDSILILDVTFAQPTYGNETLTACDSVTWNGITYDSSGTFIDTIPNHLGCDSIVTIDVNLVGDYDMRFLVAPVSLIAPPFIFPFINATPNLVNYDFTWDFGDGTLIATNDTNITHEYQYNGVYTVKLIAEDMVNNCGADTLEKVNLINCSGGPSLSIEEAFNNLVLYPNPARYVVNIDYGTEKDFSNHFVEIVNGIGQVIFTNMMNSSKTQISVSELGAKGIYFINIKDANNKILVTKHLIVN